MKEDLIYKFQTFNIIVFDLLGTLPSLQKEEPDFLDEKIETSLEIK